MGLRDLCSLAVYNHIYDSTSNLPLLGENYEVG